MRGMILGLLFLLCAIIFIPPEATASENPVRQPNLATQEIFNHEFSATDSSHDSFRKEKLITAILAFPVPFGFTGLHRIYLGTEPWIPVAYLLTGGGGAGIVPLIDFIFILSADEEQFKMYQNNPNFFMWIE